MSDQPNLLFCCFDLIPGPSGLSRRITEYLRGLTEKFQVVVLSAKTPDVSHIERFSGARLLRVPVGNGDLAARIQAFDRAVRRQMESEEFAVVHCFDPFGGYALCELKTDYGYRFIYDAASFPSHELKWTQPDTENDRRFLARIRRQELYCLMNADAVITGSETTRKFIASLGVATESIRVFPAPVDLTPYTPAAMGKPDASPMKAIYLGSQLGYQGLTTLLRAMQLALRQTDVRLTVVGPRHNEWQPQLEDLVEELKLKGKVEFQPPVSHDDLHKIIALADVGVIPLDSVERNTVQGGALAKAAEYLAGGRPVIAADLEVTRELIPEGAASFFPPGDYKALSDVLVSLSTHPEQRVAMGAVAAREAFVRFDGAQTRARLLELYESLQVAASQAMDDRGEPTRSAIKAMRAMGTKSSDANKAVQPPEPARKEVDDRAPTAITDPAVAGGLEPPVVMGSPLREAEKAAAPPPPPPRIPSVIVAPQSPPQPAPIRGTLLGTPSIKHSRTAMPEGDEPLGPGPQLTAPDLPRVSERPSSPRPIAPRSTPAKGLRIASPIPTGSQAGVKNPILIAPPVQIPTGSQAKAKNPLTVAPPAPIPTGSQAKAKNPLAVAPPAPIPTGSQAKARNPIAVAPPVEDLQPGSDGVQTDKRIALGLMPVSDPATPAVAEKAIREALPSATLPSITADEDDGEPEEVSDDALVPLTDTQDEDPDDGPPEAEAEADVSDESEADSPELLGLLDPWLAQLVHGWCPPESGVFGRLPPPTTFPGRENPPGPSRP